MLEHVVQNEMPAECASFQNVWQAAARPRLARVEPRHQSTHCRRAVLAIRMGEARARSVNDRQHDIVTRLLGGFESRQCAS